MGLGAQLQIAITPKRDLKKKKRKADSQSLVNHISTTKSMKYSEFFFFVETKYSHLKALQNVFVLLGKILGGLKLNKIFNSNKQTKKVE